VSVMLWRRTIWRARWSSRMRRRAIAAPWRCRRRLPGAAAPPRREDAGGTAYNLVGFQTRMTYGEQARIFRMIPGLEECEILRYGSVHRNTFVNAPELLDERMQLRTVPNVYLAGQITGVEGYVESAAGGYVCSVLLAQS